ncbi:hypothetical protein TNCV_3000301 [Trichonephila clavipes]|nr:hypothetical protein TNCV_3000301 [Trichonephila clavipes]
MPSFYIVNFVKQVRSTSPDMMLIDEEMYTVQARKKESCTWWLIDPSQVQELLLITDQKIFLTEKITTVLFVVFQRISSALSRVLRWGRLPFYPISASWAEWGFSRSKIAGAMAEDKTSQYLGVHVCVSYPQKEADFSAV